MPADDAARPIGDEHVSGTDADGQQRWCTPTGAPCPRSRRLDGGIEGTGDCHGCGICLLLGGLVD